MIVEVQELEPHLTKDAYDAMVKVKHGRASMSAKIAANVKAFMK